MKVRLILATLASITATQAQAASPTLANVQGRHKLECAVITEVVDWNKDDIHGDLSPLGREICRAVGVATLGVAGAVEVVEMPGEPEALHALQAGQVDVVVGATPSASVALRLGVQFGPAFFWDAQTFMVHGTTGIAGLGQLAGQPVCYIEGTEVQKVLVATMKARGIAFNPFDFQEQGEMDGALLGNHCRAMAAYASKLAEVRSHYVKVVHDLVLLGDQLALAPAAVATRAGDAPWSEIVGATVDALIEAQMLGISHDRVAAARASDNPLIQHLVGTDWSAGLALGLAKDWAAQVIGALGNYGEIYARTVGEGSPLRLPLGPNTDCLHGGVLCAPPVR